MLKQHSPGSFEILAHRGSCEGGATENTLGAFSYARSSGILSLETDVQATLDGVAVLFHDETLQRALGLPKKISDFRLNELQRLKYPSGETIPTLFEALKQFPDCTFNLDIKTAGAVIPCVAAIESAEANDRVLVTSFSRNRRLAVLERLPDAKTSSDVGTLLRIWASYFLGMKSKASRYLKTLDALQIPTSFGVIRFDDSRFIDFVHSNGVKIHYWTINELAVAKQLKALGADGIVTDKAKMMSEWFTSGKSE